jgi:hypothetical protein
MAARILMARHWAVGLYRRTDRHGTLGQATTVSYVNISNSLSTNYSIIHAISRIVWVSDQASFNKPQIFLFLDLPVFRGGQQQSTAFLRVRERKRQRRPCAWLSNTVWRILENGGITPRILNLGVMWRCLRSFTFRPPYHIYYIWYWLGPKSGLDVIGIEPRSAMLLTELHRLIHLVSSLEPLSGTPSTSLSAKPPQTGPATITDAPCLSVNDPILCKWKAFVLQLIPNTITVRACVAVTQHSLFCTGSGNVESRVWHWDTYSQIETLPWTPLN